MDCSTLESRKFKRKLFKLHDVINSKQQTIIGSIKEVFEGENMQSECSVLGYRVDLYFHDYKIAIEIDECGHDDRNINYEMQRQKAIEKELGCVFIRINPDEESFNERKAINKIHRYIKKSNKKLTEELTKKSLINKISKRLLELEFEENHSIIFRDLKFIVKNILPSV